MPRPLRYALSLGLLLIALLGIAYAFPQPASVTTDAAVVDAGPAPQAAPATAPEALVQAANDFLALLNDAEREGTVYAFEDEERFNWHFVPLTGERKGLVLKEMSTPQRKALHHLLQTGLSTKGYLKAVSIMHLERILRVLENGAAHRDPELYYLTIFGSPSMTEPWGWRVEGHHLSINFSSVTREIATTPTFMGSNPGEVPSGPEAGWRILSEEEDQARLLMARLDEAQRERAVLDVEAPRDIITGNDRQARLDGFEGLKVSDMTDEQRAILMELIKIYTGNMAQEIAEHQLAQIETAGIENLYFAWAGSLEKGAAHYYRIHGPTVLFEYDNTQNDANHIHTVWRDLKNDFGEDLLRKHYDATSVEHGH